MSVKQTIRKTFNNIKKEYGKIEFTDKILDLISIIGFVLFIVSLITVYLSGKFNVVNIVFILYPMIISGMAAATRMRKREDPASVTKLFKDWIWVMSTITVIAVIVIIVGLIIA